MAKITLKNAQTIEDAFEDFIFYKNTQDVTEKTIIYYRTTFQSISKHLDTTINISDLTKKDLQKMIAEIYSTIYVSNVAEDIARDIEQEQADHLENDYKHRMAVNRSLCIGLLKSDLIYIILEDDPDVKEELMQHLYDEISENIVPVRPDRHYERNTNMRHSKYSNTHKRSF